MAQKTTNGELGSRNVVAKGTLVKGEVHGAASLELQGTIDGSCTLKGTLLVATSGCLLGHASAANVIVQGEVKGNIVATKKIDLGSSSQVCGDIAAPAIVIADGARFEGSVKMGDAARKKQP